MTLTLTKDAVDALMKEEARLHTQCDELAKALRFIADSGHYIVNNSHYSKGELKSILREFRDHARAALAKIKEDR